MSTKTMVFSLIVLGLVVAVLSVDPDPPKQHRLHGSCKLYLNELFVPSFPAKMFVELGKHCPPTANQAARTQRSLLGYQVLLLIGTSTLKVYAKRMLHGEDLCPVEDFPTPAKISKVEEVPSVTLPTEQPRQKSGPSNVPEVSFIPALSLHERYPAAAQTATMESIPQYQQVHVLRTPSPIVQFVPAAINSTAPLAIFPLPIGIARPEVVVPPPISATRPPTAAPHPRASQPAGLQAHEQRQQAPLEQPRQPGPALQPPTTTPRPAKGTTKSGRISESIVGKLSRKPRQDPIQKQDPDKVVSLFAFEVPKPFVSSDSAFAVVLLYYGREARDKKLHLDVTPELTVTEQVADNIRTHMIDAIVYGKIWEEDIPQDISSLFESAYGNQNNFIFLPHRNNEVPGLPAGFKSVSRCDNRGDGFRPQGYKYSALTFGKLNECPEKTPFVFPDFASVPHPYTFRGIALSVNMKKLVLNTYTAFNALGESDSFTKLTPAKKTALVTSLNYDTVLRVVRIYEQVGKFEATGRKPYVSQLQKKLEEIDLGIISKIIKSYYAQNKVPVLKEIYDAFISKVREEELKVAVAVGPVSGEAEESLPPLFYCSKETFRSLLHKLGYVYGKLDTRSVILQDERIVRLRYKYLQKIRENDALGDKGRRVIYLDETWFDPYSRKSYGWRPKHPSSYKEASEYTFQKHKVGRGPRLIILHAGGLQGMIPETGEVYAVSKQHSNDDYHDNIHGERFQLWFSKLLHNLDKFGTGKYIIVMDNARYHSVSTFPSKSANKPVLLQFLLEKQGEGKLPGISITPQLRKWELQDILSTLKETDTPYKIDRMALERGHEVVRLPPYNCDLNPIEMVWSYVKRELRRTNIDQNLQEVKRRAQVIVNSVTADMWKPYVEHVKKIEQKYWEEDGHYDTVLETYPGVEAEETLGPEGEVAIDDLEFELFEEDWDEEDVQPTLPSN